MPISVGVPVPIDGRMLPTFTLRQEELPNVSSWEVNGKYYLVLKVEMVSKRNTKAIGVDSHQDREKIEGDFQVLSVRPLGNTPVDAKTLEREDFERTVASVRSGKM